MGVFAIPLTLPRVVAGVAAVIAVNVLWFSVDARLHYPRTGS